MVLENSPSNHEIRSIRRHVGIHVNFTFILQSHTPLVPQAQCEVANLDRLRLFHQWKCSKCNGHGLSVSCVKWPLGHTSYMSIKLTPTTRSHPIALVATLSMPESQSVPNLHFSNSKPRPGIGWSPPVSNPRGHLRTAKSSCSPPGFSDVPISQGRNWARCPGRF